MAFVPYLIRQFYASRINQIDFFRKYPLETQEKVLRNILNRAVGTEWGKQYSFNSISSVRDFQSRVPVRSYEEFQPWIDRLLKGESNVTWPGYFRWFAKSSGTTSSKSKFIPVSRESLNECHFQALKDILAIYVFNNPATRIFAGKALTLGGSTRINQLTNNSLYGDLSAVLLSNSPFYAEFLKTPGKKTALIEDFEKKLDLITRIAVRQNVTSLSGVPSWYLTLIKNVLAFTGRSTLHEVWPGLEVFFHGGISFNPYREIYNKLIPAGKMHYMETYNASEGFFGIQDDPSRSDMLLMLDYGIFYEFIPSGEYASGSHRVYTLGEVRRGLNYAMVISTNGGLWRYSIGDTIIFTETFPFRFRITGRTKQFINAFGEEVIVENADKALDAAARQTGAIISEYTAGPVYMGISSRGSHEWIIEFEKEPDSLERFVSVLDDTLKAVNSDYEAKRYKDINLVMPVVRVVPAGTFVRWMKSKNKLGGQNKVPRLSNTREIIEELYGFLVTL